MAIARLVGRLGHAAADGPRLAVVDEGGDQVVLVLHQAGDGDNVLRHRQGGDEVAAADANAAVGPAGERPADLGFDGDGHFLAIEIGRFDGVNGDRAARAEALGQDERVQRVLVLLEGGDNVHVAGHRDGRHRVGGRPVARPAQEAPAGGGRGRQLNVGAIEISRRVGVLGHRAADAGAVADHFDVEGVGRGVGERGGDAFGLGQGDGLDQFRAGQRPAPASEVPVGGRRGGQGDRFVAAVASLVGVERHIALADLVDGERNGRVFDFNRVVEVDEVVNDVDVGRVGAGVADEGADLAEHQGAGVGGGEVPVDAINGVLQVPHVAGAVDAHVAGPGDGDGCGEDNLAVAVERVDQNEADGTALALEVEAQVVAGVLHGDHADGLRLLGQWLLELDFDVEVAVGHVLDQARRSQGGFPDVVPCIGRDANLCPAAGPDQGRVAQRVDVGPDGRVDGAGAKVVGADGRRGGFGLEGQVAGCAQVVVEVARQQAEVVGRLGLQAA